MKTFIVEADYIETVTGRVGIQVRAETPEKAKELAEQYEYDDMWTKSENSQGCEFIFDDSVTVVEK